MHLLKVNVVGAKNLALASNAGMSFVTFRHEHLSYFRFYRT